MSEVTSIELLFDDRTEAAIRAEWDRLAAVGLSSMAAHTSASNRPHITVLVRPELADIAFSGAVARLPLAVRIGAPVLFGDGDRRVLARSVLAGAPLVQLHAEVHREAGPGSDAPHTAPDEWMPHVTLGRRMKLTDLPAALRLIQPHDIVGTVTRLRRWDAATARVIDL
ncbi:2'-5' RNA ligase family protein [Microbacterium sp. NPDC089189]|uniref:2'-5' RNA ligase family protein n=1 Tax=Microbacterium sp. NPDC089189 TaxID=3154972 RepID=UPI003421F48C